MRMIIGAIIMPWTCCFSAVAEGVKNLRPHLSPQVVSKGVMVVTKGNHMKQINYGTAPLPKLDLPV